MSFSHAVPFSSQQLQTLAAWGERRPCGLEIRIALDHAELDEVAEVFRAGDNQPTYRITAVSTGEIDICANDGRIGITQALAPALAWVEQQESALRPISA